MELDEAIAILLELLRNGRARNYGYDLYARTGAEFAVRQRHPHEHYPEGPIRDLSPIFYEASWELCRRGIVRPGVRRAGEQAVEEGGYSLTVAGRAALENLDEATILIAQPGSLAATFNGYRHLFGDGFHQRAIEAIKCRNAEAWLACCAMVGAAAESILLATAIKKNGDEEQALNAYRSNRGGAQSSRHSLARNNIPEKFANRIQPVRVVCQNFPLAASGMITRGMTARKMG